MDVVALVMLLTSLLREGMPLYTDLLISPKVLTWSTAGSYCQKNNGRLIVLDSQEKWDDFTAHDVYKTIYTNYGYWTGMRFNDTITCRYGEYMTPWNYNGWGNWNDQYNEPNNCPTERCIRLQYNAMASTKCELSHRAICEIESSAPNPSTSDPISTPMAELTGVSSTTPVTPEADVSSTTVPTTTATTEAIDNDYDVSSTTPNTPDGEESSTVPTTSTKSAGVESVVSSTTPSTPEADASSTISRTMTEASGVESTTLNSSDADESSTTTTSKESANETSSDATTTDTTGEVTLTSTTSTTATSIPSEVRNDTCDACCVKAYQTRQLDQHEREEIIHLLRVQLAVNKTNLSSQRRKLISVYDSRHSSVAMGGLACAVLGAIVGVIVVPDIISLGRFVYNRFQIQRDTLPILV